MRRARDACRAGRINAEKQEALKDMLEKGQRS
jgi:hypothetical protein